jgi:hypothetical protein
MDREPFAKWDIFADEPAPYDVITLLQKSAFNAELIRAFAQRQRAQNLLVGELCRLLEPASEFTKLAVANIETRNLTQVVVESWKPVVASALNEWARQRMLSAALSAPPQGATLDAETDGPKVVTTQDELDAFAVIAKLLGESSPVGYEDTATYFKVHVAKRRTWVFARLQLNRRQPVVWVPMSPEETSPLIGDRTTSSVNGWTLVTLDSADELGKLGSLFRSAHDHVIRARESGNADDD